MVLLNKVAYRTLANCKVFNILEPCQVLKHQLSEAVLLLSVMVNLVSSFYPHGGYSKEKCISEAKVVKGAQVVNRRKG